MVFCGVRLYSVQISACSVAGEIASSGVPISLMSGWMDQTATSSIHIFYHSAKAPGKHARFWASVELLIDSDSVPHADGDMPVTMRIAASSGAFAASCNLRLQVAPMAVSGL